MSGPTPTESVLPTSAVVENGGIARGSVETPAAGVIIGSREQVVIDRIDKDGNPDLVLHDIAQSNEQEIIETPAAGMDLDPRYQSIRQELEQKWLQEHQGEDFLSEAGQNYHLGYTDPKDKNLSTLKSDSSKSFREKYPADARAYDIKERARIYDHPYDDPAIKEVEEAILQATNSDTRVRDANRATGLDSYGNIWDRVNMREAIHGWNTFIDNYPEKAKAYAERGHAELQRAFTGRERTRQYQKPQQPVEPVKTTLPAEVVAETGVSIDRKEAAVTFSKDGPTLSKILSDSLPRNNPLESVAIPPQGSKEWRTYTRTFTEREGLQDLDRFLQTTITVAQRAENRDISDRAAALRENMVYIGENELNQAVNGIARRLVDIAGSGQDVFVYASGLRSERYISLKVLDEFGRLAGENLELRNRMHFSESKSELAAKLKELNGKGRIVIPDDFAVSGSRIKGFAEDIFSELIKQGFAPEQAALMIEADLVADVKPKANQTESRYKLGKNLPMKVFAYYGVNPPVSSEGGDYVLGGAMTGSHASVDYGFENPIEEFQEFLISQGVQIEQPLLAHIQRPYEFDASSMRSVYKNPELQAKWEEIMKEYKLDIKQTSGLTIDAGEP